MAYEAVLYDVAERICTITLNRPDRLNAWTRQMHLDLKDAMLTAGADPEVRAIILTGAGRGQRRCQNHQCQIPRAEPAGIRRSNKRRPRGCWSEA